MRHSVSLVVVVGLLLALTIALARAAQDAGASALITALASTGGAGLILLALASMAGRPIVLMPQRLLFYAVAGGVSYALPNLLVFAAASRVGSGFAAMLHAVVPALTYLVAIGWGLDRLAALRLVGLVLGLGGAALVIIARLGFSTEAETAALLLALIAPFSIAFGNVLRSRYWPTGAGPLDIAPGMLLAAAAELGLLLLARPTAASAPAAAWPALAALVAVAAVFYALYFRLQHVAGPVYLSQIGYVATGFALPIAAITFGERITPGMLVGAALIVVGVLLVRPSRPADTTVPVSAPKLGDIR